MPVNLLDPRQTPEPLKKARPVHWHCDTHGDFDAMVAVGCPECMRMDRELISDALTKIQSQHERLTYISKHWESQVFGETLSGLEPDQFLRALDRLMADYPTID
jgi:hypothetical protein